MTAIAYCRVASQEQLDNERSRTAAIKEKDNVEVRNYDPNGALCLDKQGVAVYNYTYDKWGNRLNESFYGIKNNPTL